MAKTYQAPIVKKAFIILNAISKSPRGLKISELSAGLDISKSTVHGITAALEEQGAVIRDLETKRYSIGPTLIALGKAVYEEIDFKDIARPFLEDLMEQCEESVFFGVKSGDRVTIIDIIESRKDIKITSPIGTTLPLMAGAVGKLLLSRMDSRDLEKYLSTHPLIRYTPKTIIDPEQYTLELEKTRQTGYATDDEEYLSGVRAVAVPIHQYRAYSLAVWVVGFKASMTKKKIPSIIEQTLSAARKINRSLPT